MSGDSVTLVVFLTLVVGGLVGAVVSPCWRKPKQEEVILPIDGYVQVDTLSSKGKLLIYVYDIVSFRGMVACGFPTLESIKTYIETGHCDRLRWEGNFFTNIHVWVGICRGNLTSVDERRYSEGIYMENDVRSYLKEVYDYNNLGE